MPEKVLKMDWKKPKVKRIKEDYQKQKCLRMHPDAEKIRQKISKQFDGQYSVAEINSFAFFTFGVIVEKLKIKKGDDLESIIKI